MKTSNSLESKPEETMPDGLTEPNPKRKKYQQPQLKLYGDIRSITHGGGPSAKSDSGNNAMSPP